MIKHRIRFVEENFPYAIMYILLNSVAYRERMTFRLILPDFDFDTTVKIV